MFIPSICYTVDMEKKVQIALGSRAISLLLPKKFIRTTLPSLIFPLLLIFLTCRPLPPVQAFASGQLDFFYFNPDSVQSNFSLLTRGMNHFFTNKGYEIHFQAFSQQADFDLLLATRKPTLVMVPAWYYEQYGKERGLTPLLTPLNGNKANYTKILLERSSTSCNGYIAGKTVAVTSMGPNTDKQLAKFFNNGRTFDFSSSHIIITPKDADALYALALGQVDLAVVGKNTIDLIGAANAKIVSIVKEISPSKPVPMPLFCILEGATSSEEAARIRQIFLSMTGEQPLPEFMDMLQFNGWQNAML